MIRRVTDCDFVVGTLYFKITGQKGDAFSQLKSYLDKTQVPTTEFVTSGVDFLDFKSKQPQDLDLSLPPSFLPSSTLIT